MIQTLFPKSDAFFQEESASIHTAGTVQSLFEEYERELQYLSRQTQSPHVKVTE
jgi:hypothetical protein